MRNALRPRVVSLPNVLRVCARAAIALILTLLSVGFASAQDSWATRASDPFRKAGHVAGEINDLIYVSGIFDQGGVGNQSDFRPRLEIYSPASNTWTAGTPPGLMRAFASAGVINVINEKLYVVGGCILSDCNSTTNALEIYDPVTDTWTNGAPMPTARFGAAAGVIAGELYVTGGSLAGYVPTNVTEVYNPVTNAWSGAAPIPTSRELAVGAVVDGLWYVIGGYERGSVNAAVGTVHVYNPIASSWSTRLAMPTPRYAAAVGVINEGIYVVGGSGIIEILDINESYDPVSDVWTARAPMPTARTYTAGSVVNSKLYVIDGYDGSYPYLGTNEVYSPVAPITDDQCKNGGWKTFGIFKNQGDCMQYVNTGK
jgi:N-acetylneuraminic acid mutarotase